MNYDANYIIHPFNEDNFSTELTRKVDILTNFVYVVPLDYLTKLVAVDRPIKNERIFLENILNFLSWVEAQVKKNPDRKKYIIIHTDIWIKYFNRDNYKKYQKILKDCGIMKQVPQHKNNIKTKTVNGKTIKGIYYLPGQYASRFKIEEDYITTNELSLLILPDKKRFKRTFKNEIKDLPPTFVETIRDIELDVPRAVIEEVKHCLDAGSTMNSLRARLNNIFRTTRHRFIKMGQNSGRIYHSFSNLGKPSRKCFKKVHFYDIDVVNSQPSILAAFLKKEKLPVDAKYVEDVENAIIYERFYDLFAYLNLKKEDLRKMVKVNMYSGILFGFKKTKNYSEDFKNNNPCKYEVRRRPELVNTRFKELYPMTWESLKKIHKEKKKNGSLAVKLQQVEAFFFNLTIPEYSTYYFTLFDGIYFNNLKDKMGMVNKLKEFFFDYGVAIKIK